MQGLILFAHGARDPRWAEPFERVLARVRAQAPATPAVLAYLELLPPNLATAATHLLAQGCTEVAVLPLFLGAGGHVRRDLPAQLDALRQAHPHVRWVLHAAAGESQTLVCALADWACDAVSATPGPAA